MGFFCLAGGLVVFSAGFREKGLIERRYAK